MKKTRQTALVTGATAGLGAETVRQLAADGYGRVILTGRTVSKADVARETLSATHDIGVVETLALDLDSSGSVAAAVEELVRRGSVIDVLILNAGLVPGAQRRHTAEGIEQTYAATLVGHHRFVLGLAKGGLLSSGCRIVISGSEAARGDVPFMTVTDLQELATSEFSGDRSAAASALIRGELPTRYNANGTYATAKAFVALWAAALSTRLPDGVTVNAISPGATPNTEGARQRGFLMRRVMVPMMALMPRFLKMSAPVSVGARRYIDGAGFDGSINGEFYASAPGRMVGDLQRLELPLIRDLQNQSAVWDAVVAITGMDVTSADVDAKVDGG